MRKWHRWLTVLFGVFILFTAATGLLSHGAARWPTAAVPAAAAPAGFVCPEMMTCRPKPPTEGPRAWVSYFVHLHSGAEFGRVGIVLSIATGFALCFFAFSGLWMYIQLFRARSRRERKEHPVFWQ